MYPTMKPAHQSLWDRCIERACSVWTVEPTSKRHVMLTKTQDSTVEGMFYFHTFPGRPNSGIVMARRLRTDL